MWYAKYVPPASLHFQSIVNVYSFYDMKMSPRITDDILIRMAPSLKKLESLQLTGCPKVTHKGVRAVLGENENGIMTLALEGVSPRLVRRKPFWDSTRIPLILTTFFLLGPYTTPPNVKLKHPYPAKLTFNHTIHPALKLHSFPATTGIWSLPHEPREIYRSSPHRSQAHPSPWPFSNLQSSHVYRALFCDNWPLPRPIAASRDTATADKCTSDVDWGGRG